MEPYNLENLEVELKKDVNTHIFGGVNKTTLGIIKQTLYIKLMILRYYKKI